MKCTCELPPKPTCECSKYIANEKLLKMRIVQRSNFHLLK